MNMGKDGLVPGSLRLSPSLAVGNNGCLPLPLLFDATAARGEAVDREVGQRLLCSLLWLIEEDTFANFVRQLSVSMTTRRLLPLPLALASRPLSAA
jgi:hypothetical protein